MEFISLGRINSRKEGLLPSLAPKFISAVILVCGVIGGVCRSEHQIVLRNASLKFIIGNVSVLFLLTHQLGAKIMSKNLEAILHC